MLKGMKTSLNLQPPLLINNLMPLLQAVHPVKQGNEPRPATIEPLEAFDEMERGCFGAIFCHSLFLPCFLNPLQIGGIKTNCGRSCGFVPFSV